MALHRSTIVAFWRGDCAPCVLELRNARAYHAAASPARLLFVGLQEASALESAASKAKAPAELVARALGDPAQILTLYGDAPPRLPLAVAFTPSGAVCARHSGLLGVDQVRIWARTCGVDHADR
jgi:hypothetical protein